MENQEIINEYEAAMFAANEAGYAGMTAEQVIRSLAERAEAAEAKLEMQKPVAWTSQANLDTLKSEQCKTLEFMTGDKSIYSNPVPLFTPAAPAVSLAELVPDKEIEIGVNGRLYFNEGWNACRAAILRNIEDANNE